MAHIILTGATGLVGSAVLDSMIKMSAKGGPISRISILSRGDVRMAQGHDNINVIKMKDFNTYDSKILEELKGAEGCVWAQGISATQVSKQYALRIIARLR
jgi:uncharacterized protein YbjT (DUF2867 family)